MKKYCAGCGQELIFPLENNKCLICGHVYNENEIELPSGIPFLESITVHSADQSSLRFNSCKLNGICGYSVCGFFGKPIFNLRIPEIHNEKPVIMIGKNAFRGEKDLINVHLPKSLRSIDESAFEDCSNLFNVTGGEQLSYIGDNAFRGCIQLSPNSELFHVRFACPLNTFAGCYQLPVISSRD